MFDCFLYWFANLFKIVFRTLHKTFDFFNLNNDLGFMLYWVNIFDNAYATKDLVYAM